MAFAEPSDTMDTDLLCPWPLPPLLRAEELEGGPPRELLLEAGFWMGDQGMELSRAREVAAADGTVKERVDR